MEEKIDQNPTVEQPPVEIPISLIKKSKLPLILVVIILLVVVGVGGIVLGKYLSGSKTPETAKPIATVTIIPTPTIDPTANWKTYTSNKIGYSLKAPQSWFSNQNEDDSLLAHQDYVVNLTLSPESLSGMVINAITIIFPVSIKGPHYDMGKLFEKGLEGLAVVDTTDTLSNFSKRQSSYTTISGKRTLITIKTSNLNPPADFAGSYCGGCTQKNYYIDLGNDKILEISAYWTKEQLNFESTFDQILSTFKFNP